MLRDVIGAGAVGPAAILIIISTVIITKSTVTLMEAGTARRHDYRAQPLKIKIINQRKYNHLLILNLPSLFNQVRLVRQLKAC